MGQRHPLIGRQAEPSQAPEEEGTHTRTLEKVNHVSQTDSPTLDKNRYCLEFLYLEGVALFLFFRKKPYETHGSK